MDHLAQQALLRAQANVSIALGKANDTTLSRDFARAVIAHAAPGSMRPLQFAAARWGVDSGAVEVTKAGIAVSDEADLLTPGGSARDAYFKRVSERSILGQLLLARSVPFNTRIITPGAGASGYWVAEKRAVPVSRVTIQGEGLPARKVAGLVVLTNESLRDPASETRVFEDITDACIGTLDTAFLADDAGTREVPTGILYGVTPTPSVGDATDDLAALVDSFAGDLSTAAVICDPVTVAQLALHGGTAFQNLGVTGGVALGVPWIVSHWSPRGSDGGQIVLLDQAALALGVGSGQIARSTAASIEADDDPAGDGAGPDASSANRISLFQNDLTALLVTMMVNWRLARPGAVSAVSSCNYGASS